MAEYRNLSAAISDNGTLTEKQKSELFALLSSRVRAVTRDRLARRLALPLSLWPNHSRFQRVCFEPNGGVSYCAGQDYPSEIAELRGLILKG